jgi:hypothetical protein
MAIDNLSDEKSNRMTRVLVEASRQRSGTPSSSCGQRGAPLRSEKGSPKTGATSPFYSSDRNRACGEIG